MERDNSEGPAEKLPVEVIGDILSRVEVARDVINASLTCKKWRDAYRKHLKALSFDISIDNEFAYLRNHDPTPEIEMMITKMIFQSPGLRKLSILMDNRYTFSAGLVVTWLMLVRETLSELFYKVDTSISVDVLDICDRQKLETLSLSDYDIGTGELNFQRFPCLTSLSLCRVGISVEDLNRFLSAFPKLESLKLDDPFPEASNYEIFSPENTVEVHCPTLKTLFLDNVKLFQFILGNSRVEHLQMDSCHFGSFKVCGIKTLRDFKISYSEAWLLEIEETDNLESFEIIVSRVSELNLFPMMKQSPKLKRFHFWGFKGQYTCPVRGGGISLDGLEFVLDLERVAICSPQLSHLAIFCDEGLDGLVYKFGGSIPFEKVIALEIGWDGFAGFEEWAEKLLKCCPNVKKVIVHWVIRAKRRLDYLKDLSEKTSSMIEMMLKYQHIQVQFAYIYDSDFC